MTYFLKVGKEDAEWRNAVEEIELLLIREFLREEKISYLEQVVKEGIELKITLDEEDGLPFVEEVEFFNENKELAEHLEIWSELGGKEFISGCMMHLVVDGEDPADLLVDEVNMMLDFEGYVMTTSSQTESLKQQVSVLSEQPMQQVPREQVDELSKKLSSWYKTGRKEQLVAHAEEKIILIFEKKALTEKHTEEDVEMIAVLTKIGSENHLISKLEKVNELKTFTQNM